MTLAVPALIAVVLLAWFIVAVVPEIADKKQLAAVAGFARHGRFGSPCHR